MQTLHDNDIKIKALMLLLSGVAIDGVSYLKAKQDFLVSLFNHIKHCMTSDLNLHREIKDLNGGLQVVSRLYTMSNYNAILTGFKR